MPGVRLDVHLLPLPGDELERLPGDLVHDGDLFGLLVLAGAAGPHLQAAVAQLQLGVRPRTQVVGDQVVAEC